MDFQVAGAIVIGLMAVATSVAVGTTLYLYRWRRLITSEQALFVPEELVSQFRALKRDIYDSAGATVDVQQNLVSVIRSIESRITSLHQNGMQLLEASITWRAALDERDKEIRRFRSGYDLEIFGRFISRFARVRTATDELIAAGEFGPKALDQLRRLLDDAFDECGIEQFRPDVGEDYRLAVGVADNPKQISTRDPNSAFRIAEVIAPGYRSQSAGETSVFVPARVSIFVLVSE